MNVLIIDLDKVNSEMANYFYKKAVEISGCDDWIMLPKGIDLLQDMPIEWMRTVRNRLSEKIRELECGGNGKNINC